MGDDWSREEVEATAAEYFCMLDKELRGIEYSKTEHRRHLSRLLNVRSDGAIERKHQNISAILIKLGFPYVSGYKPLRNYQRILYDAVSNRLNKDQDLLDLVQVQINEPAAVPTLDDILTALVDPPVADLVDSRISNTKVRELTSPQYKIDYLEQEARNRSLGQAGERFILEFERARLIHAGYERLASKVEHVSATRGDRAGYDVLSFDITGREKLIEVKTTTYGAFTPFFVTKNEVDLSNRDASKYYLYRAFNFRRDPKLFAKHGPIDQSFNLYPQQYIASLA